MLSVCVPLQSLLAQHKDFGAAFEPLQKQLSDLQSRVHAESGLQQDLPRKQAQLSRLQVRALWGPSSPAQVPSCILKQVSPLAAGHWPNSSHGARHLRSDLSSKSLLD